MGRVSRRTASTRVVAQARRRISKPSTVRTRRNPVKPARQTRGIRQKSLVSRIVSKPSQSKIRRVSAKTRVRVAKTRVRVARKLKRPVRTSRPFKQVVRKAVDSRPQFDDQFFRNVRVAGQKTKQSLTQKQQVRQTPKTQVTQFGGGSAINNVFGLIQQTSQRNAERKAILKAEGRLPAQQPRREPIINIEELFGGF